MLFEREFEDSVSIPDKIWKGDALLYHFGSDGLVFLDNVDLTLKKNNLWRYFRFDPSPILLKKMYEITVKIRIINDFGNIGRICILRLSHHW